MAKEILKNDAEEYDAKQPPVTKESGLKAEAAQWKSDIEGVGDKKLLGYIMDCCSAKLQQMSADEKLTEKNDDGDTEGPEDMGADD